MQLQSSLSQQDQAVALIHLHLKDQKARDSLYTDKPPKTGAKNSP